MNLKRKQSLQCLLHNSAALVVGLLLLALPALAGQIKILDNTGNTQSMLSLSAGSSASIQVTLKAESGTDTSGLTVTLSDATTKAQTQTTTSNNSGIAEFGNVSEGTYTVTVDSSIASITDIQITKNAATTSKADNLSEDKTRSVSRAMYVAGASAVTGALGVTAAALDSNSGSNSGETGLGIIDMDTAAVVTETKDADLAGGVNTGTPKADQVGTLNATVHEAPDYDPTRPDDPTISSSPSSGSSSSAPPAGTTENPVGSSSSAENTDEPGDDQVVPKPDDVDPQTIT